MHHWLPLLLSIVCQRWEFPRKNWSQITFHFVQQRIRKGLLLSDFRVSSAKIVIAISLPNSYCRRFLHHPNTAHITIAAVLLVLLFFARGCLTVTKETYLSYPFFPAGQRVDGVPWQLNDFEMQYQNIQILPVTMLPQSEVYAVDQSYGQSG